MKKMFRLLGVVIFVLALSFVAKAAIVPDGPPSDCGCDDDGVLGKFWGHDCDYDYTQMPLVTVNCCDYYLWIPTNCEKSTYNVWLD